MPRTRSIPGRMSQFERPVWEPLLALVGARIVRFFMWMNEVELDDGTLLQAYKHVATRRYLHLDEEGRAFGYVSRGRYVQIDPLSALRDTFEDWEEICPEPDAEDIAALERARAALVQARA